MSDRDDNIVPARWFQRDSAVAEFIGWVVYSLLWLAVALIVSGFRWIWLCAGTAMLLGFFTGCLVDVFAVKKHQTRLRKRFEAGEEEAEGGDQRPEVES